MNEYGPQLLIFNNDFQQTRINNGEIWKILQVSKYVNNMKILAEPGSTPLSKNTVKIMLKYLQRCPSVDNILIIE